MAIKVNQSPDDPVLPTTVRDEIVASSRSRDGEKRELSNALNAACLSAIAIVAATIVIGGIIILAHGMAGAGGGRAYHPSQATPYRLDFNRTDSSNFESEEYVFDDAP